MVRISDQWAAWLEAELERLDLDELEELARLLGAELLHEDPPVLMLVPRIDDADPQPVFTGASCPRRDPRHASRHRPRRSGSYLR